AKDIRIIGGGLGGRDSRVWIRSARNTKRENADLQQVARMQRRLIYGLAVDVSTIHALQIEDPPHTAHPRQTTMPSADIGERQAKISFAVPAQDHFGFLHVQESAARLHDQ